MISGSSVCRGTFGSPLGIKNATFPKGKHMKIDDFQGMAPPGQDPGMCQSMVTNFFTPKKISNH